MWAWMNLDGPRPHLRKMERPWLIWIFVVIGISSASGNICNNTLAEGCYAELINYESVAFPLYGADEAKLEDTCGNINMSLECVDAYSRTCDGHLDCDKECKDLLRYIHAFMVNTGLPSVTEDLCAERNPVKEVYLENYKCLEKNSAAYSTCHEKSELSQAYLNTINGPEAIDERCCYFLWYFDCFINVTRDNCNENATLFVSYALQKLVGHIRDQLCVKASTDCGVGPPMPPQTTMLPKTTKQPYIGGSTSLKPFITTIFTIAFVLVLCLPISWK